MVNILHIQKDIIRNKILSAGIGVAFFVTAMVLGAYVRIPVPGSPVPITLQTFFALLSGAVLGKRLGLASQMVYMLVCAPMLAGPTGGYIVGFAAASYFTGSILERKSTGIWRIMTAFAVGNLVIYCAGASWLVMAYKMSISGAFLAGVAPFIVGDIAKVSAAAIIFSGISGRAREIF